MTVAAITAVLGGRRTLKRKVDSDLELTQLTRQGLPVGALLLMAQQLAVERRTVARVVGISDRTLSREDSERRAALGRGKRPDGADGAGRSNGYGYAGEFGEGIALATEA